jgi:hypothetical protein
MAFENPDIDMMSPVEVGIADRELSEARIAAFVTRESLGAIIRQGVKLRLGELAASPEFQARAASARLELDRHAQLLEADLTSIEY